MNELVQKVCGPCNNLTPRLSAEQISLLSKQVLGWETIEGKKINRKWKLNNFADALSLVNKIGVIAESEGHHPDISLGWGYVEVTLWTHAIKGLSENDFILAAKIDSIK
jgi:4a-hydroxytetrahydrobiopterin dehydratase